MIYLDTHVAAWLYAGLTERLSPAVRDLINTNELAISPMVTLELQYLYETARTAAPGEAVVRDLVSRLDLRVDDEPFSQIVARAVSLTWTRDPFDRIIVGHAALLRSTLVTKDRRIRDHYPQAFWTEP
jgi:PIN domain nuclease of toxin-antitoxin system